jgi:hypothetical protein
VVGEAPEVHIPSTATPGIKIAGEIDLERLDKQLLDHLAQQVYEGPEHSRKPIGPAASRISRHR